MSSHLAGRLSPARAVLRRLYGTAATHGHDHHHSEFNEPTGYLFNRLPGEKEPPNPARTIFIAGYMGGLALFGLLYYYKPDTTAETAARKEALRRMVGRGQDPEQYRYGQRGDKSSTDCKDPDRLATSPATFWGRMAFEYPAIFSFPPFFTKQVHDETWRKQLDLWTELVLAFCQENRIFTLDYQVAEAPFVNAAISRRASSDMVRDILEYMTSQNLAEPLSKSPAYLVHWKKPSDWADLIYAHVRDSGQLGGILTAYELFSGDDTAVCEFHGLPELLWPLVLRPLIKANKAVVFGPEGDKTITPETGIKFV